MELKNIMSIGAVIAFIIYILFGTAVKRSYLKFALFGFPVIDLFITPVAFGGFRVFDIITYLTLLLLIRKPKSSNQPVTLYGFFLFLLAIVIFLGCLHSEFVMESLISLLQFASVIVYAVLLVQECYKNPDFYLTALKGIKVSCLLSLVFLGLQLIFGLSFAIYDLNPNASAYDALTRYPSFFQDPQKYAQFLAISSFLFLIEARGKNKGFLINALFFAGVVIGLFLTGVRAAFFGLCIGMLVVFLFGDKKIKVLGLTCLSLGMLTFLFFSNYFAIFNRSANVNDSADVRYAYWQAAYEIFSKYPYLGIGIGNYQHYVSLHAQNQYWEYFDTIEYVDHPESGYLKFLAEFGVIGFTILMGFVIVPVLTAVRALLIKGADNKMLLFLVASVISWMVAFTTVYSFSDVRVFVLVVTLICLMLSVSYHSLKKAANEI